MAQLLDKDSVPSTNTLLDLFSVPPTQTVIDSSYWYAAHSVNTVKSEGPFKFVVPAGPDYLQLGNNYLWMKAKITKPDGTAMVAEDTCGTINMIGKTLFQQVKVSLNGKLAYDSGDLYAYRTCLETELNYGFDAKSTVLQAALYCKDKPANKVDDKDNEGWKWRAHWFNVSADVELMGGISCDLFLTDRLMLSNTQLQLELHRNSDKFVLMAFGENVPAYKLEIIDMIWYVKCVRVASSVHLGIEAALQRMPAKYPLRRVAMSKLHISPGRKTVPTTSVFDGQIPRRVVLGFVESDAYFGDYKKSPFVFGHNNVREISVHAGGQVFPRNPLKMDFKNSQFVRAYLALFETLGMSDENKSNWVSMKDYKNALCLFAFDLTPIDSDAAHWELIREGTTTVHCEFADSVVEPGLEMIVYAEFDNVCMVDRFRSVYFDYTV